MATLPTLEEYKEEKIKTLGELAIVLKPEQIEHMNSLPSEMQVDAYARQLIMERW